MIEILGKPKEHVEKSMKDYLQKIKEDQRYKVLREEFAELKKQDDDLWATFTELEMELNEAQDMTSFCFDYMPSVIEIISPANLVISEKDLSDLFNDLQARLHQVDMIAKQLKMENDGLKLNMGRMLKNYLVVVLGRGDFDLEQLSKYTGVSEDKLGDYLDKMIDEGLVLMEKGIYSLNGEKLKKAEIS